MTSFGFDDAQVEDLLQNSPELVCEIEFGGNFKRLNKRWSDVLGWDIEYMLSVPHMSFVHPKDIQRTIDYEKNFIPTGFVNRYRAKDGSYRYLRWIGLKPICDPDSPRVLSIVYDVTFNELMNKGTKRKIKWLKKLLGMQKHILQPILDLQHLYIGDIGSTLSQEKTLHTIANHFVTLTRSDFGFVAESDGSRLWNYTWANQGEDHVTFNAFQTANYTFPVQMAEVLSSRSPIFIEESDDIPEKEVWPAKLRNFLGLPLKIENRVVGVVALANPRTSSYSDLVEWVNPLLQVCSHKLNELQLERMHAQIKEEQMSRQVAEEASKAKSAFLAHMSHELRTPLSGIIGLIEIIDKKAMSPEDKENIKIMSLEAKSLLELLNTILDISRIEQHQMHLEERIFEPREELKRVSRLYSQQAEHKGLKFSMDIDDSIPNILVGDSLRLGQVLRNILGNSIKFTSAGAVSVDISGSANPDNTFKLEVSVSDTGMGMSPEIQKKLFHPFTQADSSMSRRFGGSGLGLFIAKQLCQMMGGDISVKSEVGKGTVIAFSAKFKIPETSPVTRPVANQSKMELPPLRILVAEDNPLNQKILKHFLRTSGIPTVKLVSNGIEALEAIESESFDMVLMDGEMPIMNGLEAARQIRQKYEHKELPIIGITASGMKGDRQHFLNSGMNGYVLKPVERSELIREILAHLPERKKGETA